MFIAMNRFKVTKGCEAAFEKIWLSREVPGFVEFHLLRGPEESDGRNRPRVFSSDLCRSLAAS